MDKTLISIFIPAIDLEYDVFIPNFLPVGDVCKLLGAAVTELSNARYVSSGQELLCSIESKRVLKPEYSLEEHGIQNGEHLLFC